MVMVMHALEDRGEKVELTVIAESESPILSRAFPSL